MKSAITWAALIAVAAVVFFLVKPEIKPTRLTCEYAVNPFSIDETSPRLSWINISSRKGEFQTAYRIRVASTKRGLYKADLWDSGKIVSDQSTLVKYAGKALESMQECWWQVCVWDSRGRRSLWSEPAFWGTGILDANLWKVEWIGAPWQGEEGRDHIEGAPHSPAPLLRKSVTLEKEVASAKAYVTGLGFFQFYVNGERVSDAELTPNETSYTYREGLENHMLGLDGSKFRGYRVQYYGYDITEHLHSGENVFGAILGCGFFDTSSGWVHSYGTPRFFGQIFIQYKDGSSEVVTSDTTWLAHKGPVTANGMYDGEVYDARLEVDGWCSPGTAPDSGWAPAVRRKAPDGKLCAHHYTSDRIMEKVAPKSLVRLEDGSIEIDFGDYLTGWVRLEHLNGNAGDSVKIEYLCESPGNGENIYVMKGGGNESYAARFTWFCFDKVRITGYPGNPNPDDITAEAVYADLETTGHFACSNELFNRINRIWWRSQTDNMHLGVPTDCPHREKGPYTGDGEVACVTVMHNFDAASFYTKWMRDISDCQDVETGYVPNGAPWHPGCGGGVGWGAAMNVIPWEFYLHYGDRDILEEHYHAMTEHLRNMRSWMLEDGTMHQRMHDPKDPIYFFNLGDWLPPYELPDDGLVHTFLLWKCTDYTAKAAEVLGKEDDAALLRGQAKEVADAFNNVFYDREKKSYGDYGSNILALKLGVPDDRKEAVLQTLREEISRYDGHLNTGIIGTQLFFETLAENGMNDLAFEAMNKRDFPSFGWWIEQGAYTTWEAWNGENSRNHPMFGGALTWFYRKLAGMEVDEKAPGYRHIIFRPMPCGDITWAEYRTRTPYGEAGIRWSVESGRFTAEITVPVGCTATFIIPGKEDAPLEFGSGLHRI